MTSQANPDDALCDHYLPRKKRFCRSEKREGSRFCHTHDTFTSSAGPHGGECVRAEECEGRPRRVPCPINPNHTVYAARLQHHIQVCPDLRYVTRKLPYYKANVNALRGKVYCRENDTAHERQTHHHLDADNLRQLIERVRHCYFSVIQPQIVLMAEEISSNNEETSKSTCNMSAKHGPQHRALLRCLQRAIEGFFKAQTPTESAGAAVKGFVEFGAGKGGLSVALQDALLSHAFDLSGSTVEKKELAPAHVHRKPLLVVVDVGNFRRKGDARVSRTSLPLVRLRLDIKDLELAKALRDPSVFKRARDEEKVNVSTLLDNIHAEGIPEERWVALGKHLCGACTDFALSCITSPNLCTEGRASVIAVVFATCCHHLCELRDLNALASTEEDQQAILRLPGTEYTISAAEFAAIASMSSWAVSGTAVDKERQATGVCCKRVIDALRIQYLKQNGYRSAYLCQYIEKGITEENVTIVAFR
ncbi:hypothetical protein C3747_81g50 [Trypanosoma cruzi]|uniref:tRNA:m(4)X modification enzyme TRM13 n=2 Tax=Trypanosoma cruzi TaxID=5693 RepID=A0A2V2WM05_TRYCR|nr:hypothetical protein C3747_81g50 [Trypanosoma cruzi]